MDNRDNTSSWLQWAKDKALSALGYDKEFQHTGHVQQAISLRGTATPGDKSYDLEKGAHLKVGSFTDNSERPSEKSARYEQSHQQRQPALYSHGIDHNGAVRDAVTGQYDMRVRSAERVSKGYVQEQVDRLKSRDEGMSR